MRTLMQLAVEISRDADQRQTLAEQTLSFDDSDAVTAAEFTAQDILVPAGAVNLAVAFGGVTTASTVLIVADAEVTVKFDGTGSPAIPVRPVPATADGNVLSSFQKYAQPGVVLWRGKVSSIHLGNPSGTDPARVFIALTGNAT